MDTFDIIKTMTNTETFKDIPRWEGIYQVSNMGRVKSLARKWSPRESILTPSVSHDKYLKVDLKANGRREQVEINRLVSLSFLDMHYISKGGLVCDHIDRNRKNNNLSNLRIVTHRENNHNTSKSNQIIGAYKKGSGWISSISIDGKQIHLGSFETAAEAGAAYQSRLEQLERFLTKMEPFNEKT